MRTVYLPSTKSLCVDQRRSHRPNESVRQIFFLRTVYTVDYTVTALQ